MKKLYLIIIVTAALLFFQFNSSTVNEEVKFYYAFEKKTPLYPKDNTLLVKYTYDVDKIGVEELIKTVTPFGYKLKWHTPQMVEITTESKEKTNALKTKMESLDYVYTCLIGKRNSVCR